MAGAAHSQVALVPGEWSDLSVPSLGSLGPAWCQEHPKRPLPKPKGTRPQITADGAYVPFSCRDEGPQTQALSQACRSQAQASSLALASGSPEGRLGADPVGKVGLQPSFSSSIWRPLELRLSPLQPPWRKSSAYKDCVMTLGPPRGIQGPPHLRAPNLIPPAKCLCVWGDTSAGPGARTGASLGPLLSRLLNPARTQPTSGQAAWLGLA